MVDIWLFNRCFYYDSNNISDIDVLRVLLYAIFYDTFLSFCNDLGTNIGEINHECVARS